MTLTPLDNNNIKTAVNLYCGNASNRNSAIETYGPIEDWDVSNVTNMHTLFHAKATFNENIGSWNVSNVTDMTQMFFNARAFNQPIGNWDVSKVTNMY